MTRLRQGLLGLALLAALTAQLWSQHRHHQAARTQAQQQRQQAEQRIAHLQHQLHGERQAQARLRASINQLRQLQAQRNQRIEELQHEDPALATWAAQPLPPAASRLHQRPALDGAAAYRAWLSSGGGLPTARDSATH